MILKEPASYFPRKCLPSSQLIATGLAQSLACAGTRPGCSCRREACPHCSAWGHSGDRVPGTAQQDWKQGLLQPGVCDPSPQPAPSTAPVQDEHSCPWMVNPELMTSTPLFDSFGVFFLFLPFAHSAPALAHNHPPTPRAEGAEDEVAWEVPGTS